LNRVAPGPLRIGGDALQPGLPLWMSFGKIKSKRCSSDAPDRLHVWTHIRNVRPPTNDHSIWRSALADGHINRSVRRLGYGWSGRPTVRMAVNHAVRQSQPPGGVADGMPSSGRLRGASDVQRVRVCQMSGCWTIRIAWQFQS
jgi:hypothetical protein